MSVKSATALLERDPMRMATADHRVSVRKTGKPVEVCSGMGAGMPTTMKTSVRFPSRERLSGEDYAMNRFLFDNRIGICRTVE